MAITAPSTPRAAAMSRDTAMRLAATEYQRFLDLLRALSPGDWSRPTECPGWDVRAMASHALGMVELAASVREQYRQMKLARGRGGVLIDALTGLQVDERQHMTPEQIVARFSPLAGAGAGASAGPADVRGGRAGYRGQ